MTPIASGAAVVDLVVRTLALAAAALAGLVALVMWAVRAGHVTPFGPLARATRALANPALRPVEGLLRRFGRNPQDAPTWLFGLTVVLSVALLSLVQWVLQMVVVAESVLREGPESWGRLVASLIYNLLSVALVIRVLGSWVGAGRYARWTRPAWLLTDWLVEPIRRRLPALGPIDLSPLIAWFLLGFLMAIVMTVL